MKCSTGRKRNLRRWSNNLETATVENTTGIPSIGIESLTIVIFGIDIVLIMKMYEWIMKILSCCSISIPIRFFICEGWLFTTISYGRRFSLMRVSFRVIFVSGSFSGGFGLITISYHCALFPIWLVQYLVRWYSWNKLKSDSFHQCLQFFIQMPGI